MSKNAKKIIALADQNKMRRQEPFRVVDMDQLDVLITDLRSDHEDLDAFRSKGLQII